jgi:DNA-binding transcriptional MerR regulator
MLPERGDGLLNTAAAARLVGVKPPTIRRWRYLGYLRTAGTDERGFPLHHPADVREADLIATEKGLSGNGLNPRKQRGKPRGYRPDAAPFPAVA